MTAERSRSREQALQKRIHRECRFYNESKITQPPTTACKIEQRFTYQQSNNNTTYNVEQRTYTTYITPNQLEENKKAVSVTKPLLRQNTLDLLKQQNNSVEKKPKTLRKSGSLKDLFNSNRIPDTKSKIKTRSKFADIVQNHLLPLSFITSLKQRSPSNTSNVSCPTLTVTEVSPLERGNVKVANRTEVKDEEQYLTLPFSCVGNQLNKTDTLFTTSFTHSNKSNGCDTISHSDPNVRDISLGKSLKNTIKQSLVRSYSDVPFTNKNLATSRKNNVSPFLQSKMFKNNYAAQVLEHLFIGSVEAAYNEPLLCKLKIDCLLDITNMLAEVVPTSKKLRCPCMCPEENQHFRSRLIIQVDDDEKEDIQSYFADINKFIHGAKRIGKRVLVVSYAGKSRAPVAVIQYLMEFENFLLREAYNLVKNQRSAIDINSGFMTCLEILEKRLFPEAKPSVSFGNEYLNIADPQAIKCAWVNCTDT